GRQRYEAGVGKAPRDIAFMLDQAERFVQHDYSGIGTGRFGPCKIASHLDAIARELYVFRLQRLRIFDFTRKRHGLPSLRRLVAGIEDLSYLLLSLSRSGKLKRG